MNCNTEKNLLEMLPGMNPGNIIKSENYSTTIDLLDSYENFAKNAYLMTEPMYSIGTRKVKMLGGHAVHRDNYDTRHQLKLNKEFFKELDKRVNDSSYLLEKATENGLFEKNNLNYEEHFYNVKEGLDNGLNLTESFKYAQEVSKHPQLEEILEEDRQLNDINNQTLEELEQYEIDDDFSYQNNFIENFAPVKSTQEREGIEGLSDDVYTFREWKEYRLKLIDDLNRKKRKLFSSKKSAERTKQINTINELIKKVEDELKMFDDTDPVVVFNQLIDEINNLNEALNIGTDDFQTMVDVFENNNIRDRILKVREMINNNRTDDSWGLYYNLMQGLDEQKIKDLKIEVNELLENYENKTNNIIKSIIRNQETIQYDLSKKSEDYAKKFYELLDKLVDLEKGVANKDALGQTFLSASMYDSVFAELLSMVRNNNQLIEENTTSIMKDKLKKSFSSIGNIKLNNGKTINDVIFARDEFGVKQKKIISPLTKAFYGKIKELNSSVKNFMASNYVKDADRGVKYRQMMQTLKSNVDYIELYKIKSVRDKYKDHQDFKDHFSYSEQEMSDYEKEMREKMGDIAFEMYLEKAVNEMEIFLEEAYTNPSYRYHHNPLNFIKHFYSKDFHKEDSTTADFIVPKFTNYIPSLNKQEFYNSEFSNIERQFKEKGKSEDFKEFYKSLHDSLEYVKEAVPNMNVNDVINIAEHSASEVIKNLGYFKNISRNLGKIIAIYWGKYVGSKFFNGNFSIGESVFRTNYIDYGAKDFNDLCELKSKKSIDELLEEAKREGLTIPQDFDKKSEYQKEKLVDALITNQINKTASNDLMRRVNHALNIAESVNTRRNTQSITEFVKDYLQGKQGGNKHLEYIENWEKQVINESGYLDNKTIEERNTIQKIERTKIVFGPKKYTEIEKEIKRLLESEKKNLDNITNFTTTEDGKTVTYFKDGNKYYKQEGDLKFKISKADIENEYIKYIDNKLQNLGKDITVGSLTEGLRTNITKAFLVLSPITQVVNRMAGYMQNNMDAAAGVYGFGMKELINARKFNNGISYVKFKDYAGLDTSFTNHRRQQQHVFIKFLQNHNLIDNAYEEMTSSNSKKEKARGILSNIVSDLTTNIAEFNNQSELLLSMMQNEMIEKIDADGNIIEVPFFNPETMSFPFNPDTMQLLPEFRTENNIKNIEDKESPFLQNLLNKYRNRRNLLNGAYDKSEKIKAENSVTGKTGIMMLKWYFANLNNEWGTKQMSLANTEMNVKGRKVVLAEHFPVLATHKLISSTVPILSGAGASAIIGVASPLALGVGGAVSAYAIYKLAKEYKKGVRLSKKDFQLSANYAMETALRSINSIIQFNTGLVPFGTAKRIEGIDTTIDKLRNNSIERLGISEKDRKIMSASAQQLAESMNIYFTTAIAGIAMNALSYIIASATSDDDEELYEKLKESEKRIKFLMNTRNTLLNDVNQYTSPDAFLNILESKIFYNTIKRSVNKIVDAPKKYEDGKISKNEMYWDMFKGVAGPVFGIPNIIYTDKLSFKSDRIYNQEFKSPYDDYLLEKHLDNETLSKRKVSKKRRKVRQKLTEIYTEKVREMFEEEGREDYYNIEEIVKKNVKEALKDTYKSRKENYEDIVDEINIDEIIEDNKDNDLDIDVD